MLISWNDSISVLDGLSDIMSLARKHGWKRGIDEAQEGDLLRWLPSDDPDVGTWAYVKAKVIRSDGVDSMTIFDVGGDPSSDG